MYSRRVGRVKWSFVLSFESLAAHRRDPPGRRRRLARVRGPSPPTPLCRLDGSFDTVLGEKNAARRRVGGDADVWDAIRPATALQPSKRMAAVMTFVFSVSRCSNSTGSVSLHVLTGRLFSHQSTENRCNSSTVVSTVNENIIQKTKFEFRCKSCSVYSTLRFRRAERLRFVLCATRK